MMTNTRAHLLFVALLAVLPACTPKSGGTAPAAETAARPPGRFLCTTGEGFTLAASGETAILTTGNGHSARLTQQKVASGFWYAGEGESIRGKGPEVTWTRADGTSLSCREEQAAAAQPQNQPPLAALVGPMWTLVAFQSSDDAIGRRVPPNPERYTLRFAEDGSLALQLDCNRATGRYSASSQSETGGSITINGGAMTRAMCGPGAMDTQIARDLQHIRSYTLKEGRLFLALMADGGIYEFRRN
jgi:para-nitrobenzyl esterase